MAGVIKQGVDCWLEARNIISVRTGLPMDVTGCSVHAVARALYDRFVLGKLNYLRGQRWHMMSPVVAEWSTTPTGTQGQATAGGATTDLVSLHITPTQTSTWRCPMVIIQAELTDPISGYIERIIDHVYEISFEVVTN